MFKLVVLFSAVCALAAGKPSAVVAPVAYSAYAPGLSSVSQYSSAVVHGPSVYSAPLFAPYALAQPPHSPAVVLDAVHGVPLDTPEVVAARAAHYQAKALSGPHYLKKRSVAPVAYSSVVAPVGHAAYPVVSAYSSPVVSAYSSPVVSAYASPLVSSYSAYSSPVVGSSLGYYGVAPKALSVHPW